MQASFTAHVVSNREIAPGAYLLRFKRSFDFIAGQVIRIGVDTSGETRLYSIASGNSDENVDILYTVNPEGGLTPALSGLRPGDHVLHSEAFGRFICREECAVWIAAGTGIAPFASMAFSGQHSGKILLFGGRSRQRLYFHGQLKELLGSNYIPCCSRESFSGAFHGRVTDYLKSLKQIDLAVPHYLCGSAGMVVDVRDILIEKGLAFEKVFAEIFF